eukprot:357785-Chlamydomonas_euryale.AAC.3
MAWNAAVGATAAAATTAAAPAAVEAAAESVAGNLLRSFCRGAGVSGHRLVGQTVRLAGWAVEW